MKNLIIISSLIAVISAQLRPEVQTPPPVDCPNSLCNGKYDGNFELSSNPSYFLQCVGGLAYCQACWPMNLKFSQKCNQCLYNKGDECFTTKTWQPATTFYCPDICGSKGYDFKGNIPDPNNSHQYVGCWNGVTVGCVACPGNLKFNEKENACLYEGKYFTEPLPKSS